MATSIQPWLAVSDGAAAVDFYHRAFGAAVLEQLTSDAAEPVVAQLTIGGAPFWIQHDPENTPIVRGAGAVRMILAVDDPAAWFERAVTAGAAVVGPVSDAHGWRTGRVTDPFGHDWELSRKLS
jgi:PhnB protein